MVKYRWFPAGRMVTMLLFGAVVAGCELGSTTIPRTDPMLVVHSILNPGSRVQTVLVEHSLTGAVSVVDSGNYDPANPIATGNGVPVSGAIVRLTDPDGLVMTATEFRPTGTSTGVYQISLDAVSTSTNRVVIQRGKRYSLSVTAAGKTVTGSTLVPQATTPVGVPVLSFNRDHQAINLPIQDVSLSRAFWIRLDAPIEAYSLFTLDQDVAIAGDARNIFTEDLIRIFYPGFLQTLTVAAVDTNVYDYYRSGNDPFSGSGLINHLSGGLGVFGSMVIVEQRRLDVTQDATGDSIEATYTLRRGGTQDGPHTLTLFREASGIGGGPDRISGRYLRGPPLGPIRGAIYGSREASQVTLNILVSQSTARITSTFRATVKGDSLIGTFLPSNATATFVKTGK